MNEQDKFSRWRLILGKAVEPNLQNMGAESLSEQYSVMDKALSALYDETEDQSISGKNAGLGASYPNLATWLGDIRSYFPKDVISVIQNDAIQKKGLSQLLFEPETLTHIKPDINMVSTILSLKNQIPKKSKEQARILVKSLVDDIMADMERDLQRAVTGALNKRKHSPIPSLPNTDWKRTISKNLKHYDRNRKKIIPEKFYFFENRRVTKDWQVIVDMDQSGSMASSIIYASIMGSIFASLPALETRIVAFDTSVVDLTENCGNDPVDILFGVQLGGGTDINKSVDYCSKFINTPAKTLFILISDLYEGGVEAGLIRQLREMHESGVKVLVLLALTDQGQPSFDERLAKKIAELGIACFGCTPSSLPELVSGALKGDDLVALGKRLKIGSKEV